MKSAYSKGFSLIEIMVAVVVLGIVMAIGVPAFREFIQNTSIRSVAESLQNGLQVARGEAVRRNAQVRFTVGNDMGWAVGCVTVSTTCPEVIQRKDGKEGAKDSVYISQSPGGASSVVFTPFGNVVQANTPLTQIDVDSRASGFDPRNLRIMISSGGIVRLCDPAAPSTDARAC